MRIDKIKNIKYFIVDVDGTMTDSGIYYDDNGNELKRFSTRDGEAIKLAKSQGIKIVVITGRQCNATKRRMEELEIDYFAQGVLNKYDHLIDFMKQNGINKIEVGYIGDDINDLKAMTLAGFVGCPADSCKDVLSRADYIAKKNGGAGAVRDVVEYVLRQRKQWDLALKKVYDIV